METYLVGGAVRDELLGVVSKDLDYSVVLDDMDMTGFTDPYLAMRTALIRDGYKIYTESPEHYTIRAKAPNGDDADFVLAREEGPYSDGRRPDWVKPGTLIMDLQRRDFTMNALAKDDNGNLIDLFGGRDDIKNKIIRTVGDPYERFGEDALRIVRAMRFDVTKGFFIEPKTAGAMLDLRHTVAGVSAERVREELTKMFNANPMRTIQRLQSFDLFKIVFDMGINFQPTMKSKIK